MIRQDLVNKIIQYLHIIIDTRKIWVKKYKGCIVSGITGTIFRASIQLNYIISPGINYYMKFI